MRGISMAKTLSGERSATTYSAGSHYEVQDSIWQKRISNHIAYALLAYTGLQIFVVMGVMKEATGTILPYFGLIVLVGLIIPLCRKFEKRWERLGISELSSASLNLRYKRDRLGIWLMAIGLPFAVVALFRMLTLVF